MLETREVDMPGAVKPPIARLGPVLSTMQLNATIMGETLHFLIKRNAVNASQRKFVTNHCLKKPKRTLKVIESRVILH